MGRPLHVLGPGDRAMPRTPLRVPADQPANARRTAIKPLFQLHNLAVCAADPVDTLLIQAVLFDRLAALDDNGRHVDVVARHLVRKVDAKRRPALVEVSMSETR